MHNSIDSNESFLFIQKKTSRVSLKTDNLLFHVRVAGRITTDAIRQEINQHVNNSAQCRLTHFGLLNFLLFVQPRHPAT